MTLNEWVKTELEYWQKARIKDDNKTTMVHYCEGRIDAAKAALKFVEINERDAK